MSESTPYIVDNVVIDDTVYGFVAALKESGYTIRFNLRTAAIEVRYGGRNTPWKTLNDREVAILREHLRTQFFDHTNKRYSLSEAQLKHYLDALAGRNSVDPFMEYLQGLSPWNGESLIESMIPSLFPGTNGPLDGFVSRYLFLAAIYRVYKPGFKADIMPIFKGEQGLGKSTFIEYLTPVDEGYFKEGAKLNTSDIRLVESILGAVHVEFGEIAGMRNRDLESLKAFITRRNDNNVRLSFERRPDSIPRRCVFVGSTNAKKPLPNDVTGNRRFLVVDLRGSIGTAGIREWLNFNRDALWAEALHLYHIGEEIFLDGKQEKEQEQLNKDYRDSDEAIEEAISEFPWKRPHYTLRDVVLFSNLATAQGYARDYNLHNRVIRALAALGWTKKGGRWYRPVK